MGASVGVTRRGWRAGAGDSGTVVRAGAGNGAGRGAERTPPEGTVLRSSELSPAARGFRGFLAGCACNCAFGSSAGVAGAAAASGAPRSVVTSGTGGASWISWPSPLQSVSQRS